jgi:protein-S-isoprenylcysteine O-methyltransferase Ste14
VRPVLLVIVIGWGAFWLYWLVAARNVKTSQRRPGRSSGIRVALLAVLVFFARLASLHATDLISSPWVFSIGLVIWAAGLTLAVWARRCIGRNWGPPMSMKQEPDLVTNGPYRAIRHPIYTGLILGMLGTALATTLFGLIVAAVLTGFFVYSAVREERFLTSQFPGEYPAYLRSTKMLIPFVF